MVCAGLSGIWLKFDGPPRTMDLGLLYRALQCEQVDIVAGNSTDGPIQALGFVALEDDSTTFRRMRRCRWCGRIRLQRMAGDADGDGPAGGEGDRRGDAER